ncbi:MAG: 1-acyl-sn-glycerol-3-phosphate acyltransferase [Clostridia bacterium]|nr:1-acyl-sn-glycerol-3-phosphate acyltransferase [Clostridia bacterium]
MLFAICFALAWIPIRLFYPVKVIGKKNLPKKKGYVLTCNHYSNMDPVLLDVYLNKKIRFLAKKELFEKKFVGFFLKKFGGFPVDREKPGVSSFKFALNVLKENKIFGIFPEGTRNKNIEADGIMQLKNGAIVFASKGESQIIPIVIYKKPKVFRKNYILIGEPIELIGEDKKRLTHEEQEQNVQILVNAMTKLREEMDNKILAKKNKRKTEKNIG